MTELPRPYNENLRRDEAAARARIVRTRDYDIDVDFSAAADPAVDTFPVRTRVRFDAETGASTFLDYLGARVDSVTLNGVEQDVASILDGARIVIGPLAEHNEVDIVSASIYSRSGEGVHRFVDPADGAVYLYSQNEPVDCRRIYPCFDQPDLKARFRVAITADTSWHVAANGALASEEPAGAGASRRVFAETLPMSTYITTFLAGPYAVWHDEYTGRTASGEEVSVPLRISTRASLAPSMDADEVFEITRQGLDWFHDRFDSAYPWGKYDQVFVPEYNLGAMENPGLVTFTENYVFTSPATQSQHEQRANTILHEMCHMWFGDLVTMRWWDDLWLKESFADYVGTLAVDEATRFTTAWTAFASKRKAWAYRQDQYPTTHPIVADIVDLEAADQNFDGITYAKGASVLRQLSAFVGAEAFFAAARTYFARHAWGNTTLDDFLAALSEASGRDMQGWADAWLTTAGVNRLRVETVREGGVIASALLRQDGVDPRTGETVLRPHVLRIGVYRPEGEAPAGFEVAIDARIEGAELALPALSGLPVDRVLLPNDGDLSYAKIVPDTHALEVVLTAGLEGELARATAFAGVWNMVRDGELAVERFADGVIATGHLVTDPGVFAQLLQQAGSGLAAYTPAETRQGRLEHLAGFLADAVAERPEPSDRRTVLLRTLFDVLGEVRTPSASLLDRVERRLEDPGFGLGEELAWSARVVLSAHGRLGEAALREAQASAPTAVSTVELTRALAARPDAAVKDAAREAAYTGRAADGSVLSNDGLQATIDGLRIDPGGVGAGHEAEYWQRIEGVWAAQSQGQATRVVTGLFPADAELADGDAATHPFAVAARGWLAASREAPRALRRIVIERLDDLERRLRAQAVPR
ncbi:aminopeptidase N [Agromyces archimandritae]|uniref:Aminopeptidase N n=1 Tax=Agromyces archimandritae TaxID=2781962 RepID=A0A975FPL9_9MICO|nr:aminopeptidase N [Agromyces archimandritae]QTX04861.1 aminopeptidase N [Agromyces archimandritae]